MKAYTFFLILLFPGFIAPAQDLDEYLRIAADSNLRIQSTFKEYLAALEEIPQAASLPDPAFTIGYYLSPVETRVGPRVLDFSIMQRFPWFGTLGAREEVAEKQARVRLAAVEAVRNEVFFDLSMLYYDLYLYQQQIDIMQEQLDILKSYEEVATVRVEAGGRLADVLLTQVDIERMETRLANLKKQLRPTVISFNLLLNRPAGSTAIINDSLAPARLEHAVGKLLDSALALNPSLNMIKLRKEATGESIRLARLQGLPELGAGVSYGVVRPRQDMGGADNGRNIMMPMVTVSLPVYRKKYKAMVRENELIAESYQLQAENMENHITAALFEAYSDYLQATENVELYESLLRKTDQVIELLVTEFSTAGDDYEEVLLAQNQWLEYRLGLLENTIRNRKSLERIRLLVADYQLGE